MLFGVFAFFLAVLGVLADVRLATFLVFALLFAVVLLPALVLAVAFPIAIYADAKAVSRADLGRNRTPFSTVCSPSRACSSPGSPSPWFRRCTTSTSATSTRGLPESSAAIPGDAELPADELMTFSRSGAENRA